MTTKLVTVAEIQRNEGDKWERVIAIGSDTGSMDVFIDQNMEVVAAPVWRYTLLPFANLVWMDLSQ